MTQQIVRPRYVRHRNFPRQRHSRGHLMWLARQASRLSLTAQFIFDVLLKEKGYNHTQIEAMYNVGPSPEPEDSPPSMMVRPYFTTAAVQDTDLTVFPGTWVGEPTFRYRARLFFDDTTINVGEWQTSDTFSLTNTKRRDIVVEVEATNANGSVIVATRRVRVLLPGGNNPPVSTLPPSVSGEALTDHTLFVAGGNWSGDVNRVEFYWLDADTDEPLTTVSNPTLFLDNSMVGKNIKARVIATGFSGNTVEETDSVGPIVLQENPPVVTKTPRYLAVPGGLQCVIEPEDDYEYTYSWKLNGIPIGVYTDTLVFNNSMRYARAECRVIFTDPDGKTGSLIGPSYYILL